MKRILMGFYKQITNVIAVFMILVICGIIRWFFDGSSILNRNTFFSSSYLPSNINKDQILFFGRQACSCTRPILINKSGILILNEKPLSICSQYSTLRGFHQRIIAISMYGPQENAMFSSNASLHFLNELIVDMRIMYPDWILRVYHDTSIKEDIICPLECAHNHVDFCNTSALNDLGSVTDYIPPKIWRFLPVGDPLVDIMASRDLDSPLPQRELDAVNQWLSTNKSWHAMRDHPLHSVPMLGGMWGFRPVLDRKFANTLLQKMLNRTIISRYRGRADQAFLTQHVWPYVQRDIIVHDSYLCTTAYGKNSQPWPSRRPPLNDSGCFVGCIRPCCPPLKFPLSECPIACRPKNHTDWTMC